MTLVCERLQINNTHKHYSLVLSKCMSHIKTLFIDTNENELISITNTGALLAC